MHAPCQRCLATVAVLALICTAADWPGFRGPDGSGVSAERNLPAKWSDQENLLWKVDLPGPGSSSPIFVGDRIFLTCFTGYAVDRNNPGNQQELRLHVLCLNRASGKTIWDKEITPKLPDTAYRGYMLQHGYASSTAASDGENVYVFFGKTGVLAFNFAGKELWHVSIGDGTHGWGSATSPVLYKDYVIVNASVESGAMVALDKKTGKQAWKVPGIRSTWGTPTLVDVDGKLELVLIIPNKIVGYDPATGKQLWSCNCMRDGYVCPSVVAKNGIVYAVGARKEQEAVAIRAGGRGDVTSSHKLWSKNVGSRVCSPVVVDDHMYWVNDNGIAFCLKTDTGDIVYQQRLQNAGTLYASMLAADGKLYVMTRDKGAFVLAAEPKFEQLARNNFASDSTVCNASPVAVDGRLFLRTDQALYCVGVK